MSSFEIISDYSKAELDQIPDKILDMTNLKMLFLERNLLVELPEDFFYKLPNLMWLDLRNNRLEGIPTSVAYHEHLEHLLLTNNNIRKLPNELGLVPNLKALQVADNPLIYPPKKVVQEGTKAIKRYLREQFEEECVKNAAEKERKSVEGRDTIEEIREENRRSTEMQEEKLIRVHEKLESFDQMGSRSSRNSKRMSTDELRAALNKRSSEQVKLSEPTGSLLRVKKLDQPNSLKNINPDEPLKIIHDVSKNESKIFLRSYFNRADIKSNLEQIPENVLKEGWLNKLRILLNDQERILQQERNLRALSMWRQKRPTTPKVFGDVDRRQPEPPYATYPEYTQMPSRSELSSQLQNFLRDPERISPKHSRNPQANLDKIINDLMEQLKEMESNLRGGSGSPRSEMDRAGQQIRTIVDIHKKLLQLKATNGHM